MDNKDKSVQADELARKILKMSCSTLFVNMRFLENAICRFRMNRYDGTVGTDGKNIYYKPMHVLSKYKLNDRYIVHIYLHMVLHCIFRHWYIGAGIDRLRWNLACDIATEDSIIKMGIDFIEIENLKEKQIIINEIRKSSKLMNAENIYAYFFNKGVSDGIIEMYSRIFTVDDHELWYNSSPAHPASGMNNMSSGGDSGRNDDNDNGENSGDESSSENSSQSAQQYSREELERQWRDISEQMQSELENFAKNQGFQSGDMIQSLKEINRERYDYSAFLKKFAVMGEAMKTNMDEFDYNFYTYGLSLYKNVALIEPLEYKEVKKIRDFVIAIDTSGSVSGKLVQTFMTKTYNILKSTNSFFSKVNIHIIQCDAEIQEAVKVTNQDEFDMYIKNMKLRGFGGTDFRPVFRYVDKMIKNKEFTRLKGLIYFTDGYGTFPERKPEYETAFLFIRDEYDEPQVPVWAIKLILEEDAI